MKPLDKQIEMVERIIEKQKALDIATDKLIDTLKQEKRELVIEIAGLRDRERLYKKQLHKFGVIFDNYDKQKKEKKHG